METDFSIYRIIRIALLGRIRNLLSFLTLVGVLVFLKDVLLLNNIDIMLIVQDTNLLLRFFICIYLIKVLVLNLVDYFKVKKISVLLATENLLFAFGLIAMMKIVGNVGAEDTALYIISFSTIEGVSEYLFLKRSRKKESDTV